MELQLSAKQKVPWHTHSNVSDTFYVLEGHMRLFLQNPKEEVNLKPGEVYVVRPTRPHLVTNGGTYAGEFYAGWLVEYSLSIDNLFIFIIIMSKFAVPRELQQYTLMVGIVMALIGGPAFIVLVRRSRMIRI